jgi:cytochrome c553
VNRRHFRSFALPGLAIAACALAPVLMVRDANAQAALSVPAGLPDWAFNIPDKVQPTVVKIEGIIRVPGSAKEYEAATIAGDANPPDWFPDEHPAAPSVVTGGQGVRFACGTCHLMSGQGHSESADIAGMPAAYLIHQMDDYKSGVRRDNERMGPISKIVSGNDVRAAAEYFSSLKPAVFVKVIETSTPPKTFIATAARHRQLLPAGGTEPIGHRIIEVPDDPFRTQVRDPHSGFTAWVPPGSIAKGKRLAAEGQCIACHGTTLQGNGDVPRLAGLQPLYIARQLFDYRFGSRAGDAAASMRPVAAKLSDDDIIALSAYLGSLPPR